MRNDPFDQAFDRFDQNFRTVKWFAIGAWLVGALLSVAALGLAAWAVVKLVTHFAG